MPHHQDQWGTLHACRVLLEDELRVGLPRLVFWMALTFKDATTDVSCSIQYILYT